MRKIFVDLGGHYGESVNRFFNQVDNATDYLVYSFEAHPENYKVLLSNTKKYKNVICINKAASNKDGFFELFESAQGQRMGSTILKGKTSYSVDYKNPINVEFVDFTKWLVENNITKEDYVVLKMNIEGAEYDLLDFMIGNGVLEMIKVLFISFHSHKFEEDIKKDLIKKEIKIIEYLKENNIPVYYKDDRKLYGLIKNHIK